MEIHIGYQTTGKENDAEGAVAQNCPKVFAFTPRQPRTQLMMMLEQFADYYRTVWSTLNCPKWQRLRYDVDREVRNNGTLPLSHSQKHIANSGQAPSVSLGKQSSASFPDSAPSMTTEVPALCTAHG